MTAVAGDFARGVALREAREWRAAILAFRRSARANPLHFDSTHAAVTTLATAIESGAPPLFPRAGGRAARERGPISIVVCSIDAARLAAMRASYLEALAGREHQLVVIGDARSLSEGYARGLAAARHPTVVFSHDDVELLSPHAFDAFDEALERHDVAGIAGATRVAGPAVLWAGHPHLHGWVAYPAGAAFKANLFSLEAGVTGGVQALDGLIFAARREAALAVGFDAATFDGFHFYDLDFTYRAHLAGLRLAVTTGLTALHASEGSFDDDWRRYAERFVAKFPGVRGPKGEHFAFSARLSSRESVARFYEELRGLAATA